MTDNDGGFLVAWLGARALPACVGGGSETTVVGMLPRVIAGGWASVFVNVSSAWFGSAQAGSTSQLLYSLVLYATGGGGGAGTQLLFNEVPPTILFESTTWGLCTEHSDSSRPVDVSRGLLPRRSLSPSVNCSAGAWRTSRTCTYMHVTSTRREPCLDYL